VTWRNSYEPVERHSAIKVVPGGANGNGGSAESKVGCLPGFQGHRKFTVMCNERTKRKPGGNLLAVALSRSSVLNFTPRKEQEDPVTDIEKRAVP